MTNILIRRPSNSKVLLCFLLICCVTFVTIYYFLPRTLFTSVTSQKTTTQSYEASTTASKAANEEAAKAANKAVISTADDEGLWSNLSSEVFRFYAYSAIFDDRISLLSQPVIRIIAISDPIDTPNKDIHIHCVLQYGDHNDTLKMADDPLPVGHGWPLKGRNAKEYVYACPTKEGKIPQAVGIRISRDGNGNSTTFLPVTVPKKPDVKREICVCVQVAYGSLDPVRLIEWLELQRRLGVTMVGVYDLSVSEAGRKVFEHYAKEGFVDLRRTKEIHPKDDRHYLLQGSPVINDCIYRHMHEFRRMAVYDFDEFIMPRNHSNLPDLVDHLDRHYSDAGSPHVNYAFRNNYFFLDLAPDESVPERFTVLRFRKKVPISPEDYSLKSIINPQACTQMHNHVCWGVTANYTKFFNTASVSPDLAVNQHYKKCHFSSTECRDMMKNVTQDDVMLVLKSDLVRAVNAKAEELRGALNGVTNAPP